MDYRTYLHGNKFDLTNIDEYIVKCDEKYGMVHVKFNDSNACDLLSRIGYEKYCHRGIRVFAFGDDNNLYQVSFDGIKKAEKSTHLTYNMMCKRECKLIDASKRCQTNIDKLLAKHNKSGVYKSGVDLGKYKSYAYADFENKMTFSYRLRQSESKDKLPLVIYFHGSDGMGSDNIKQMFGYLPLKKKLESKDCFVLLPQAPKMTNDISTDIFKNYIKSIKSLIDELCKSKNIDKKRIYLVGTSFGGICVWQMIWEYPCEFACAVPVVGLLSEYIKPDFDNDFSRIKDLPLWVAHSSNDVNVPIDIDDHCVAELKKIGSWVKYTRLEKYGHQMSKVFYAKENWLQWMFSQYNDNLINM